MIKCRLIMALDFNPQKGKIKYTAYTRLVDGKWLIYSIGPIHSNVYEVTDYDDEGERVLRSKLHSDAP